MKRFISLMALVLLVSVSIAQTSKRTTAYNYLRNGKLDKALENIEPCISHEKTMNDPKTWFYRGNIYLQIAVDTGQYKNLVINGYKVAYDSYKKALGMEGANEFKVDIFSNMNVISEGLLISGITKFNEKDYTSSYDLFVNAAEVKGEVGVFDSLSYYYAARSAEELKQFDKARDLYKKVLDGGYTQPDVYGALANCYRELKDNDNAVNTLKEGRELYPSNIQILFAEINFYLATGQSEKALADLEIAKTLEPNNATIFFAAGTQYDNAGKYEEAEAAYLRALEINPTYFDAIYNLGALHVNQAAKLMEKANAIPADKEKEYNDMKTAADGVLDRAIPFLEKAHNMDPSDKNTIRSLKEIYARKSMLDKVKEMDEKLK